MIIYEIIDKPTNESLYVGKSTKYDNNEEFQKSDYWGSGKYLKNVIKKYGTENLERKVLEQRIRNLEKLKEKEEFWIKEKNTLYPNGYNLTDKSGGGDNISHHPDNKKIRKKMKDNHADFSNKNNPNYGNFWTNKKKKEESEKKKHFYQTLEGKKLAKEHSEWVKHFLQTQEGDKWRKKHSEEHSEKMKYFYSTLEGKKKKKAQSERMTGSNHPLAREVILISPDGVPHQIKCYKKFCEDNKQYGLSYYGIYNVLQGKQKQHKGWTGYYLGGKNNAHR